MSNKSKRTRRNGKQRQRPIPLQSPAIGSADGDPNYGPFLGVQSRGNPSVPMNGMMADAKSSSSVLSLSPNSMYFIVKPTNGHRALLMKQTANGPAFASAIAAGLDSDYENYSQIVSPSDTYVNAVALGARLSISPANPGDTLSLSSYVHYGALLAHDSKTQPLSFPQLSDEKQDFRRLSDKTLYVYQTPNGGSLALPFDFKGSHYPNVKKQRVSLLYDAAADASLAPFVVITATPTQSTITVNTWEGLPVDPSNNLMEPTYGDVGIDANLSVNYSTDINQLYEVSAFVSVYVSDMDAVDQTTQIKIPVNRHTRNVPLGDGQFGETLGIRVASVRLLLERHARRVVEHIDLLGSPILGIALIVECTGTAPFTLGSNELLSFDINIDRATSGTDVHAIAVLATGSDAQSVRWSYSQEWAYTPTPSFRNRLGHSFTVNEGTTLGADELHAIGLLGGAHSFKPLVANASGIGRFMKSLGKGAMRLVKREGQGILRRLVHSAIGAASGVGQYIPDLDEFSVAEEPPQLPAMVVEPIHSMEEKYSFTWKVYAQAVFAVTLPPVVVRGKELRPITRTARFPLVFANNLKTEQELDEVIALLKAQMGRFKLPALNVKVEDAGEGRIRISQTSFIAAAKAVYAHACMLTNLMQVYLRTKGTSMQVGMDQFELTGTDVEVPITIRAKDHGYLKATRSTTQKPLAVGTGSLRSVKLYSGKAPAGTTGTACIHKEHFSYVPTTLGVVTGRADGFSTTNVAPLAFAPTMRDMNILRNGIIQVIAYDDKSTYEREALQYANQMASQAATDGHQLEVFQGVLQNSALVISSKGDLGETFVSVTSPRTLTKLVQTATLHLKQEQPHLGVMPYVLLVAGHYKIEVPEDNLHSTYAAILFSLAGVELRSMVTGLPDHRKGQILVGQASGIPSKREVARLLHRPLWSHAQSLSTFFSGSDSETEGESASVQST